MGPWPHGAALLAQRDGVVHLLRVPLCHWRVACVRVCFFSLSRRVTPLSVLCGCGLGGTIDRVLSMGRRFGRCTVADQSWMRPVMVSSHVYGSAGSTRDGGTGKFQVRRMSDEGCVCGQWFPDPLSSDVERALAATVRSCTRVRWSIRFRGPEPDWSISSF